MCVCTFAYMYIWVYTGELNAKRIRKIISRQSYGRTLYFSIKLERVK